MSGFLAGCRAAPSEMMRARDEGRVLFLGITQQGSVLGHVAKASDPAVAELNARERPTIGVFVELPLRFDEDNPKAILLRELRRIHQLQWIASQKLTVDGTKAPYAAPNAGGYTLEAELGIAPNGYAAPDFMGWEIKQYGVNDFSSLRPKSPVTLMTPEPTGGIYRTDGVAEFLRRFGYTDQNGKADRFNFGGRYDCQRGHHELTGLRMILTGYDTSNQKMIDLDGSIALIDANETVAASWTFKGMMAHWNRKHAQAAYVPSLFRSPPPEYSYGPFALLCEQTDFLLFLRALAAGTIYYDPGIKIEKASSAHPAIKRRSQFRVAHHNLTALYNRHEAVPLT